MPTLSARLATINTTTTSSTLTTTSFSPTAGAVLVIAGMNVASTTIPTISSISTTLSGTWSWTILQENNTSTQNNVGYMAYAVVPSSPGTGTLTLNLGGNSLRSTGQVYEATDHNGVVQSKTGENVSDTPSITLDSTPAADSMVLATLASRTAGTDPDITPGSNFTELDELYSGGGVAQSHTQMQYDAASATTTVDWSNAPTAANVCVAIEIAAAAAGGDPEGPLVGGKLINGGILQGRLVR